MLIELHDIIEFGYETWCVTTVDQEFIEMTKVTPNSSGFHRRVKILTNDIHRWNLTVLKSIKEVDTNVPYHLSKEQLEGLLA